MKRKGHYFIIFVTLAVCIYLAGANFSKTEYISQKNTVGSMPDVWSKAIASSINEKPISMFIDGINAKIGKGKIYMDDSMTLMVPSTAITEAFNCSVSLYKEKNLVIEKGNTILRMTVDESKFSINGAEFRIPVSPVKKDQVLYVPLTAVVKGFGYTYAWDVSANRATLVNDNTNVKTLPYSYSYIEKGKNSLVRDQGVRSTCWACASITALETTLRPEAEYEFSVDHMSMCHSFNISQFDGGEYTMALAYLLAWQGPVLEKDDPYGDRITDNTLKPLVHVQEAQIIASKNLEKIKEMVYKYGGVQTSLYTSITNSNGTSKYYNENNAAYCYIGEEKPNHDVVIIGWDDNYPKENFNAKVESNGAFICQSSWGEKFGKNGIFYVSYLDTNIGVHNLVYTKVEDTNNYSNIYQTDLCGWQGILGYEQSRAYFSNVYTSRQKEVIKAVGFYATDVDTSYSVYVVNDFIDENSFKNMVPMATGKFDNAGYYTVTLDNPVKVTSEKFAVVVKIDTPNSQRPVAVEMAKDYETLTVDLSDGEGYISLYGDNWERVENDYNCNICLKVYTDNYEINGPEKDNTKHDK